MYGQQVLFLTWVATKTRLQACCERLRNDLGSLVTPKQNSVFRSPFTVSTSDVPVDMQLVIINLQCVVELKGKFASVGLNRFFFNLLFYLLSGYPKLRALAAKMLWMFGTPCFSEQVFSVKTLIKQSSTESSHIGTLFWIWLLLRTWCLILMRLCKLKDAKFQVQMKNKPKSCEMLL